MGKQLLHESSATPLELNEGVWSALYITPGAGSSGTYSDQLLERDAAAAFPVGTKHFFKHPDTPDQQRDPRDQWGVTVESKDYEQGVGHRGHIKVLPHWRPVVESLAEAGQASLSIWAMGETDAEGNVTHLYPDVQNSVDLVAYPGRPGSALTQKMYESARAASDETPVVTSAQETQEGAIVEEKLDKLIALLEPFITESVAARTADKAEADAQAVEEAAKKLAAQAVESYSEKSQAIEKAEILPSQKAELLAAAKEGKDVAPLIESAVKTFAEAKTVIEETAKGKGFVQESGAGDFAGFSFQKKGDK